MDEQALAYIYQSNSILVEYQGFYQTFLEKISRGLKDTSFARQLMLDIRLDYILNDALLAVDDLVIGISVSIDAAKGALENFNDGKVFESSNVDTTEVQEAVNREIRTIAQREEAFNQREELAQLPPTPLTEEVARLNQQEVDRATRRATPDPEQAQRRIATEMYHRLRYQLDKTIYSPETLKSSVDTLYANIKFKSVSLEDMRQLAPQLNLSVENTQESLSRLQAESNRQHQRIARLHRLRNLATKCLLKG